MGDKTSCVRRSRAQCSKTCGLSLHPVELAKTFLKGGNLLNAPVYGCMVVFSGAGGGHVGIVVGREVKRNLLVLGGNLDNAVGAGRQTWFFAAAPAGERRCPLNE